MTFIIIYLLHGLYRTLSHSQSEESQVRGGHKSVSENPAVSSVFRQHLSVLAAHKTMPINSQLKEIIIINSWQQNNDLICDKIDSYESTNKTTYQHYGYGWF